VQGSRGEAEKRTPDAMKQKSETNRVEAGGAGIGEVSQDMIENRARKIAAADGRADVNVLDRGTAREELIGQSGEAPEDLIAESDRAGDGTVPGSTGTQAPRLELDDEANYAAQEVEEGIAEAALDTSGRRRD
jgi:hypothetical protein